MEGEGERLVREEKERGREGKRYGVRCYKEISFSLSQRERGRKRYGVGCYKGKEILRTHIRYL